MKSYIAILLLAIVPVVSWAVPADGVARQIRQKDGSLLTVRIIGDEHLHFALTADGFLLAEDVSQGGWCYAYFNETDTTLYPSPWLAHDPCSRSQHEQRLLASRQHQSYDKTAQSALSQKHRRRMQATNTARLRAPKRVLGEPTCYSGNKRGLVILVDFPNLKMQADDPFTAYQAMFNSPGYTAAGHVGSVHDYFLDQSYGRFSLTFDVVGPVTVSRPYGYYGSDAMSDYHDMNVQDMVREACQLADGQVNYADYDWDHDGQADQVFIIYAGYGQATGGPQNTIWPHESHLRERLSLDGVDISQYACSNELYGNAQTPYTPMGIGVACHEFSHCLGLPDLYDTDYSGAYGMSYWSLMNSGSYNGPAGLGEVPCGYTAFERWFAGWLTFTDIQTSQKVEGMPSLQQQPVAYRIANSGWPDECYTIENRQPDKWFSYTSRYPGLHGLLVTHIDFNAGAWRNNNVNPRAEHQRMSPVVADNDYANTPASLAGDLFPGSNNVTQLTNSSHIKHGGTMYNLNTDGTYNLNRTILDIAENNGHVSFDVILSEEIPTPTALQPSDITETGFTAHWTAEAADSYTLQLEVVRQLKPYVVEHVMIENLTRDSYVVENLQALSCSYHVRAGKGELHTEWSNTVSVQLETNAIRDNVAQNDKNKTGKTYTLGGRQTLRTHPANIVIRHNRKHINSQQHNQ